MTLLNIDSVFITTIVFIVVMYIFLSPVKSASFKEYIQLLYYVGILSCVYIVFKISSEDNSFPEAGKTLIAIPPITIDDRIKIEFLKFYYPISILFAVISGSLAFYIWFRVKLINKEFANDKGFVYIGLFIFSLALIQILSYINLTTPQNKYQDLFHRVISISNNLVLVASAFFFDHKYNLKEGKLRAAYDKIQMYFTSVLNGTTSSLILALIAAASYSMLSLKATTFIDMGISSIAIAFFIWGVILALRMRRYGYILPAFAFVTGLCFIFVQWDGGLNLIGNIAASKSISLFTQLCFILICLIVGVSWAAEKMQFESIVTAIVVTKSNEVSKLKLKNLNPQVSIEMSITELTQKALEMYRGKQHKLPLFKNLFFTDSSN
jgi:hypothetical protein